MLDDGKEARDWSSENSPTAEEMVEFCLGIGICPYEVNKLLLRDAVRYFPAKQRVPSSGVRKV